MIWCTGLEGDFGWVHLLGVLDACGQPALQDGVTALPGIRFLGLDLSSTRRSGTIHSIAEEAQRVIEYIKARR